MDPIEVEGPDGAIIEFPAGTDDATIEAAMAQAYPQDAAGTALQPEGSTSPAVSAEAAGTPTEGAPGYGLMMGANGKPLTRRTMVGLSEAQAAEYKRRVDAGEGGPDFPEGSNENPIYLHEGMSDEAIQQMVASGVTYVDREGRTQQKSDELLGLQNGLKQPLDNAAGWLEGGLSKLGVPVDQINSWASENLGMAPSANAARVDRQEELDQRRAEGYVPGKMGQFAGSTIATLPIALATRNPWLGGAAEGALTSNATNAKELAMDTAFGALAGKAGDVGARVIGGITAPNVRPEVRALLDEGVEVSPGQLVGGVAHRAEDAISSVPFIGDVTNAAQRRAQESVANVALQRPLTSLGEELPTFQSVHQGIGHVQQRVSQAYDDVLNDPNLNIRLDPQFAQEFQQLNNDFMTTALGNQGERWQSLIRERIAPRFNAVQGGANGRITGQSFKEIEELLGREGAAYSSAPDPDQRKYGAAVRELQAQLRDMLARGNPAHAERLQSVNDAYRQLTVLENAVNKAPAGARGRFTPNQLEMAAKEADPHVRRRAAARGDALFQDLSQNAGDVMQRTVADSGTATRGMIGAGVGALFLGKTMGVAINPWAVPVLAAGAIPYTKTGNRLFTAALTSRPQGAGLVRQAIDNNAYLAGLMNANLNSVNRNESRLDRGEMNADADLRQRFEAAQEGMQQ